MSFNLKVCELILLVRILSFTGLQLQCYYKGNFRAINGILSIVRTEQPENTSVHAKTLLYLFARKITSVWARVFNEISARNFRANSKYHFVNEVWISKYCNLCAYQMSYMETRARPKIGRQILGDFGGTKMAITSLKSGYSKNSKRFWFS